MPEEFAVDLLTTHWNGQPQVPGGISHMRHSGYEAIIHYLGTSRVYYVPDFPKVTKLCYPLRVARLMPKSYLSLHAEQAALKGNGKLLHHLYGENTLWLSLLGHHHHHRPIVATFHRPPHLINSVMPVFWKQAIHNLAGVVVLSPTLLSYMKSSCSVTNIALIPHGVDTEYFSPAGDERSDELAISVGDYLRDP